MHARMQLWYRGTSEEEILRSIRESPWEDAKQSRKQSRLDIPYGKEWNGKHYGTKQVCPVFIEETHEIVVVTVYVYYF